MGRWSFVMNALVTFRVILVHFGLIVNNVVRPVVEVVRAHLLTSDQIRWGGMV